MCLFVIAECPMASWAIIGKKEKKAKKRTYELNLKIESKVAAVRIAAPQYDSSLLLTRKHVVTNPGTQAQLFRVRR